MKVALWKELSLILDASVLSGLRRWFAAYVQSFYTDDDEIHAMVKVKEEHSLIVAGLCRELAASIGLNDQEINLAEAVGLCHDVGRFKQATIYRTFRDRNSVDHGLLGVEELMAEGVAAKLSPTDWTALAYAVRWHNAIALPPQPDERLTLFGQIIRDTDKLDIYRVLPPSPPGPGCTPALASGLAAGEMLSYDDVRTADDRKLIMLSWLFDIHFPWTLKAIAAKGYIENILAALPPTPLMPEIRATLAAYQASRLASR